MLKRLNGWNRYQHLHIAMILCRSCMMHKIYLNDKVSRELRTSKRRVKLKAEVEQKYVLDAALTSNARCNHDDKVIFIANTKSVARSQLLN